VQHLACAEVDLQHALEVERHLADDAQHECAVGRDPRMVDADVAEPGDVVARGGGRRDVDGRDGDGPRRAVRTRAA
jgi:hypothetical protein